MRALIDTCIIIDTLQARQPFCDEANRIFILAANQNVSAFITAKSVTDIHYIMRRYIHDDSETHKVIDKLLHIFGLADTMGNDCRQALINGESDDYEDAVMIETAKRSGMDCIVTRNERDYSKSSVPVYTPKQFIGLFTANE